MDGTLWTCWNSTVNQRTPIQQAQLFCNSINTSISMGLGSSSCCGIPLGIWMYNHATNLWGLSWAVATYLPTYLSIYLSIYLSDHLSICSHGFLPVKLPSNIQPKRFIIIDYKPVIICWICPVVIGLYFIQRRKEIPIKQHFVKSIASHWPHPGEPHIIYIYISILYLNLFIIHGKSFLDLPNNHVFSWWLYMSPFFIEQKMLSCIPWQKTKLTQFHRKRSPCRVVLSVAIKTVLPSGSHIANWKDPPFSMGKLWKLTIFNGITMERSTIF